MRYIHYEDGEMRGHYANPQPGYAEIPYPDDHPDILAWNAAKEAHKEAARLAAQKRGEDEKTLYDRVAVLEKKLLKLSKKREAE